MVPVRPKRPYRPWYWAWRPLAVEDELWTGAGALLLFVVVLLLVPRRYRLRLVRWTVGVLAALGFMGLAAGVWATLYPAMTHIRLPIQHLPSALDGLRIAHLSDLHLGMPLSVGAARRALAKTEASRPDLVLLTGDFISYREHLPLLRHTLEGITAPLGVFAVFGNHDHKTDPATLKRELRALGVTVLDNAHRVIKGDATLVIAGVDDMWHGRPNLDRALRGAPKDALTLLLAHSPDYATVAAQTRVAVQFAGHTHAGHIRLPLLGSLFLPRHGVRFPHGLRRVGDMWLVISNGLGGLPLRIGTRAETLLVTLRRM
jgi:uncharacterized protein